MRVLRHARLPFGARASRGLGIAVLVAAGVWLMPTPVDDRLPMAGGEEVDALQLPVASRAPRDAPLAPLPAAWRPDPARAAPDGPPPPSPLPVTELKGYVWPLAKARLTLPFDHSHWGSRLVDGLPFHDGIDLATFCGDRIVAAHDGRVLAAGRRFDDFMGWRGDLGPYYARLDEKRAWSSLPIVVVIDDGNGYRSLYAHFREVVVRPGQRVRAGELIGYEGDTGRASGCHLHYGLFSPNESATFEIKPDVAARLLVPSHQTARVNPLLVLPAPATPGPGGPRSERPPGGSAGR